MPTGTCAHPPSAHAGTHTSSHPPPPPPLWRAHTHTHTHSVPPLAMQLPQPGIWCACGPGARQRGAGHGGAARAETGGVSGCTTISNAVAVRLVTCSAAEASRVCEHACICTGRSAPRLCAQRLPSDMHHAVWALWAVLHITCTHWSAALPPRVASRGHPSPQGRSHASCLVSVLLDPGWTLISNTGIRNVFDFRMPACRLYDELLAFQSTPSVLLPHRVRTGCFYY